VATVPARLALVVACTVGGLSVYGLVESSAATSGGPATVTLIDHITPLSTGGSLTPFSFLLPPVASCSGDTANQAFHVFGYVVPSSVDPATINFSPEGPITPPGAPQPYYPLFDDSGSPFAASNTAINTGQIVTVPSFDWSRFSADGRPDTVALPPGDYNVGIACADGNGAGDRFWNAVETFAPSADDPGGFIWTVVGDNGTTTTTTAPGGGSTTTTTPDGSTTTTTAGGGGTTTTLPGGATTTTTTTASATTTTTGAGATTTTTAGAGVTTTTAVGGGGMTGATTTSMVSAGITQSGQGQAVNAESANLPRTGAPIGALARWGLAFISLGAGALLSGRTRPRRPVSRQAGAPATDEPRYW